jgi:hypothetical protein
VQFGLALTCHLQLLQFELTSHSLSEGATLAEVSLYNYISPSYDTRLLLRSTSFHARLMTEMEVDQQNEPAGEAVDWLQKIYEHGVRVIHILRSA